MGVFCGMEYHREGWNYTDKELQKNAQDLLKSDWILTCTCSETLHRPAEQWWAEWRFWRPPSAEDIRSSGQPGRPWEATRPLSWHPPPQKPLLNQSVPRSYMVWIMACMLGVWGSELVTSLHGSSIWEEPYLRKHTQWTSLAPRPNLDDEILNLKLRP